MRQNYLYKCTDCQTVKAIEDDFGVSTWALSCRACGQVVTEHYRLDFGIKGIDEHTGIVSIGCFKEKEDNDEERNRK